MATLCQEYLAGGGYRTLAAPDGATALRAIDDVQPRAVLLDYELPDMTGLDVLAHIRANAPSTVVIMMTAHASVEHAAAAMRLGAHDFLQKPFPADRLLVTLKNALEKDLYQRELQHILAQQSGTGYGPFIGTSPVMQAVYHTIQNVAASRVPVFVTGESGTGKELAAQALHAASPRRAAPFRAVNCGAIPANLLESELFGHVKGAFTGATQDRLGLLQQADGGTVFLDEVADIPLDLQVKLLRAVQTQQVRPVGSDREVQVNVRFVAATNRDVVAEVQAGRFRDDLFYRLYVVPVELPPLRDRGADILMLADHFLRRYAGEEGKNITAFTPQVQSLFMGYAWPGNVRELENVVRYAVALNHGAPIIDEMLLPTALYSAPRAALPAAALPPSAVIRPLDVVEREAITAALNHTGEDVGQAAALLQISPSTIYRKLQSWEKTANIG